MAKKQSELLEIFKLGGILLLIAAVVGTTVAFVHASTKEQILLNNMVNEEDILAVVPSFDSVTNVTEDYEAVDNLLEIYEVEEGGAVIAYVYKTSGRGYDPEPVEVLTGIGIEGSVLGIKVMKQSETPGLGSLIQDEDFISRFRDRSIESLLQVVKSAPSNDNEVQALSGATASSAAVVSAVNVAITHYREQILGEEVGEETPRPNIDNMGLTGDEMVAVDGELEAYEVLQNGVTTGFIIYGEGTGYYNTPIVVAVGINVEGVITGIMVTEQEETPGLGDVITEEGFAQLFIGNDAEEQANQVYSGATDSSRGAIRAINQAVAYFNDVLAGQITEAEAPGIENMNLTGDEMVELPGALTAFEVLNQGETSGYIIYGVGKGYYNTDIVVAVGFNRADDTISGIMVTEQSETPGFGDVILEEGFYALFTGNAAETQPNQVYSGATNSSRGAIAAINQAVDYYNEIKGGN